MIELPLAPDSASPSEDERAEFAMQARRPPRHVWAARRFLRPFLSDFALNGLFGTFPLYLLGTDHWSALLAGRAGGRLLDVGAAAGDVTAELAPLYSEVVATDLALPMVRQLRRRGFHAHRVDIAIERLPVAAPFDTVALLNVLDRAPAPLALLRAAGELCRPGGTVVVATPLPYDPWRYLASLPLRPRSQLPLAGETFEGDLEQLVGSVLPAAHLTPVSWLRTPYVSAGRQGQPLHRLDCAVVVCERLLGPTTAATADAQRAVSASAESTRCAVARPERSAPST